MWLNLSLVTQLKLYVIEPGSDVFIPFFTWPRIPPQIIMSNGTSMADIRMTKKMFLRNDNECNNTDGYAYSGIALYVLCLL